MPPSDEGGVSRSSVSETRNGGRDNYSLRLFVISPPVAPRQPPRQREPSIMSYTVVLISFAGDFSTSLEMTRVYGAVSVRYSVWVKSERHIKAPLCKGDSHR